MSYVGSNQKEITHPGGRCEDDHDSALMQGENLMKNDVEAVTVDSVKDQEHTGQSALSDEKCASAGPLHDEDDEVEIFFAMQDKEIEESLKQQKILLEKELQEVRCALELCRSAERMVSDTLANHKNLITHPKKAFTLEHRLVGKHSKRYEERARLSEDWHEKLPYALVEVKSNGYMGWRIVNRDYRAPGVGKSGAYMSDEVENCGIGLAPDSRHFANSDPSRFWLYHQDAPWHAPKHARTYLERLRYVIRILKGREENLIFQIRGCDMIGNPDDWAGGPDDWTDDRVFRAEDWI